MSKARMEPAGRAAGKRGVVRAGAGTRGAASAGMDWRRSAGWGATRVAHQLVRAARPHRWMPPIAWAAAAMMGLASMLAGAGLAGEI